MEKRLLPYLIILSALSVSISAAFYSVTGIGKMFSGSSFNVMMMMSALEIAKLVLVSFVYQYWDKINLLLKFYYIVALCVLMIITSAGIYGYLSSAYSETSNKVENVSKNVGVLNLKRDIFSSQLTEIKEEKRNISINVQQLTTALSNNNIQYRDKSGQIINTTSSSNRKAYEAQLKSEKERRDLLSIREISLNDSINSIDLKKLDLETNSDIASEIGPLKYISKITRRSVDVVVNWFIIALMLVFDPLAVSLVIGANIIFKSKEEEKNNGNISEEERKREESLRKSESELKKLIEDKENSLNELKSKIENEKKILDDINKEREFLNEYKEDKSLELSKIQSLKNELEEKERKLEITKSDLIKLDDDIKKWESTHWKLRKDPPSL